MEPGLTSAEKKRKLPWALAGDFASTVHCYLTFAPTILLIFLDRLKLDKTRIGVVLAIFPFVDMLALFLVPIAARVGYKKVFVGFWAARKVVLALLIAAPWILSRWGPGATFCYVVGVIILFSLCRSTAVAALGPWFQDFVPASIRGKYGAIQTIIGVIAATGTAAIVGWALGTSPTDLRFTILFSCAVFIGLLSVFFYSRVPGGEAEELAEGGGFGSMTYMKQAARDRNLWTFEIGTAVITVGWGLMAGFLALFYKEQAGLATNELFYLDSVLLAAGLASCFLWGWAADRFGAKPVMVLNLAMMTVYPLGLLFLLPLHTSNTFWVALGLVSFTGLVSPGWNIGYNRYFYVNLVPPAQRKGYMALHTATVGLISGLTPLIGGRLLDFTRNISGDWGPIHLNPWTPMFIACVVGMILGVIVMGQLPASGGVDVSSFAGLFFRGNPIAAMYAIFSYEMGGREQQRLATIDLLGSARSPLSIDELTSSLQDPSFNVRYEAVITIAHTLPHHRLTHALVNVLEGDDPDLAVTAAWALGRINDRAGVVPLRKALDAPNPLLRTRAARALGMKHDLESVPKLLTALGTETDIGLRVAYAAALGQLGSEDALPSLLDLLRQSELRRHRLETALAIASIMGHEDRAVKLWRQMEMDPGDALAGVVLGLDRRLDHLIPDRNPIHKTFTHIISRSARALGSLDYAKGVAELRVLAAAVELSALSPPAALVLAESVHAIDFFGHERMEYVTLCVHSMHVGVAIDGRAR